MKKYFLVFAFILSSLLTAQSINFGLKGGATYSNPSIVNAKANAAISYFAGAQLEFKFSKFAIQPEVQYGVLKSDFEGNFVKNVSEVGYLSVPVIAKIYFIKKISVDFGPQVSFALNKKTQTSLSGVPLGDILEIQDLDYAAVFGLTFNLTDTFFIQARGVYGLNKITGKTDNATIDAVLETFEVKNRVIQLGIGFNF